jgi:hypothetical protein
MTRLFRWLTDGLVVFFVVVLVILFEGFYPYTGHFTSRGGTTYFLVAENWQLRFVRQSVSPGRIGSLIPDTTSLDSQLVRGHAGFHVVGFPSFYAFQWIHNEFGWFQLPNNRGEGIGPPAPNSIFVFDEWCIGIPIWVLFLPPIVLPLIRIRLARRKRALIGKCHACGYDLRATPDRCPECGTIPTKKEIIPY